MIDEVSKTREIYTGPHNAVIIGGGPELNQIVDYTHNETMNYNYRQRSSQIWNWVNTVHVDYINRI